MILIVISGALKIKEYIVPELVRAGLKRGFWNRVRCIAADQDNRIEAEIRS